MTDKIKNVILSVVFSALVLTVCIVCLFAPPKQFSNSERRELAQFPDLSLSSVASGSFMSSFEEYAADQFPARDLFRTVKAYISKYVFAHKSNNDIYVADGIACKTEYPLNTDSLLYASKKFRYLYDSYLRDNNCNIYLSVIPDKNAFLAKDNGQLSLDYDALYSYIEEKNDFAKFIHIENLLSADDYYATDTHWKQENIVDVAEFLASSMGTELTSDFAVNETDIPFFGVYSGQSALPLKSDTIRYLTSDYLKNCKAYDHQNDKKIDLYDMEKANGKDPYEMYLSGPLSLVTIDNTDAKSDKELIIFRDSFGSAIAPLLASGYSKITLIDIRYLSSHMLSRFVDFSNSDILFLYSTSVLNNSNTLK